jgi:predicted transcriptional regulator
MIKITIELPDEMYDKLLSQSAQLHKTPSMLIAHALKDELGLVGLTLNDDKVWGKPDDGKK